MTTVAITNDSFYYEFVINQAEGLARVTKRAFKGVRGFYDQSTTLTVDQARQLFAQLKSGERL
jgi:hypothetical protein